MTITDQRKPEARHVGLVDDQCCARCGEPERHRVTLPDGREVCEPCLRIIRLEDFNERVTSER